MSKCNYCNKLDGGTSMVRCSAWKRVHYCTRDCQKKDWKAHRPTCLRMRHAKKEMVASGSKGQYRLWHEWTEKCTTCRIACELVRHPASTRIEQKHEVDYNLPWFRLQQANFCPNWFSSFDGFPSTLRYKTICRPSLWKLVQRIATLLTPWCDTRARKDNVWRPVRAFLCPMTSPLPHVKRWRIHFFNELAVRMTFPNVTFPELH